MLTRTARYSEEKCTNELDRILKTSPKVAVLLKGIQTLNKNALSRGITCRPCMGTNQESRMGYYDSRYKRVVLCCDHIRSRDDLEDTLVHELTHAFDSLRKGQCADITPEKKKNQCIWNDAVRSTEIHCGLERAEKTVKEVFQNCVHDETPFQ
ncbi:hypothetical protein PS6_010224 [Mucor atramentarius]